MFLQSLIAFLIFVRQCDGYSLGPPSSSCVDLFPVGHHKDAQTGPSPYSLIVNATSYQPGDIIEVILNTTDKGNITFFEGAMVQARKANCKVMEAIGMFTLPENETFMGYMTCAGGGERNTVAHKAHSHITNRVFYWTAPAQPVGHIFFRATVVRKMSIFWTTVTSDYLRGENDANTLPSGKCLKYVRTKEEQDDTASAPMLTMSFLSILCLLFFNFLL